MAKTSIIVTTTEAGTGKKLQKTLTDINVNASNQQLAALGRALNSLTTNIYSATDRVDKANCDTEIAEQLLFNHELKINGSVNEQTFAPGTTVTITYKDAIDTDAHSNTADFFVLAVDYDEENWTPLNPTQTSEIGERDVVYTLTLPNYQCDVYCMLVSTVRTPAEGVIFGWYGDALHIVCEND